MPDPLRHLSNFAEEAVSDIQFVAHEYNAARAAPTDVSPLGRFSGPGVGFGDRATQFAVANVVGLVEHYAERVLLGVGCSPNKIKTWGDKPTAWKKVFGADIELEEVCPSFTPMRGYYEARNAIMHRRGELTHSQRNAAAFARLAAARVERVGFHLVVRETTVRDCAAVCVSCVKEMDTTTRS